jgi:hypothetical protein
LCRVWLTLWRAGDFYRDVARSIRGNSLSPFRLQAIATPLVPNMEKVQIIPPPKDVDQRVLAWKGAAVLGKMDGISDLWLTAADWVRL